AAEPDLSTPRRALRFFDESARAHDFASAARVLDLGGVPDEEGPVLARELQLVFEQERRFDWDKVSDRPEGDSTDGLGSELIGKIPLGGAEVPVRLVRFPDGSWRIGSRVVRVTPALYKAYGPGWLGEHIPAPLTNFGFLDLAAWQWLGILLGVTVAFIV